MQSIKKAFVPACRQAGLNWIEHLTTDFDKRFKSMFFVYVLWSESGNRRYVGMSNDLELRLKQHNAGYNRSTKGYRPWKMVHAEKFETLIEARQREVYLKSGVGRDYLNKLLHL